MPTMPRTNTPPNKPAISTGTGPGARSSARSAQFKGLDDWIEIFKAGTHVDSAGRQIEFSAEDLAQMLANGAKHRPPAVLGHPKDADPAYAWADLRVEGDSLQARFTDINPEFQAAVDTGAYRNRSVRVVKADDDTWMVDHIGWLGAKRPAIPLQALHYAAPAARDQHDFADADDWDIGYAISTICDLFRGQREQIIAAQGLDVADRALPSWQIDTLASAADRIKTAAAQAMVDPEDDDGSGSIAGAVPTSSFSAADQAQVAADAAAADAERDRIRAEATAAAQAASAAEFAAATARADSATAELARLKAERRAERIAGQISGWKSLGKFRLDAEPGMAEFMAALEVDAAATFSFSAADQTAASKTPSSWFADFMARLPAAVKLGPGLPPDDQAAQLDLTDAQAIGRAASEFQAAEAKAGREISVAAAVVHVTNQARRGAA